MESGFYKFGLFTYVKTWLVLLACMLSGLSYSQFNIKVGYSFNYVKAGNNDKVLEAYNKMNSDSLDLDLEIPMGALKSMHGINLGARYLLSNSNAFELTWENKSRKREAVGEFPDGSLFQTELFYSFNQYMFGYQSILGSLGIGSAIGYNIISIKDKIGNSDFKNTILKEGQWIARVNLSYNFGSKSNVSLSLQPYVQFPIQSISLKSLADDLEVPQVSNTSDSFFNYGLSLIFYNGRQD